MFAGAWTLADIWTIVQDPDKPKPDCGKILENCRLACDDDFPRVPKVGETAIFDVDDCMRSVRGNRLEDSNLAAKKRDPIVSRRMLGPQGERVEFTLDEPYLDSQGDIWHCSGWLVVGDNENSVSGRGVDSLDALFSALQLLQVDLVRASETDGPFDWVGGKDLLRFPQNYPDCIPEDLR